MTPTQFDNLKRAVKMTGAEHHSAERILGESYFDFEEVRQTIKRQLSAQLPTNRDAFAGMFGWHVCHRSRRLQQNELNDLTVERE
jgi:hypothetical protein